MPNYIELGRDKRLNEIVIVGSHDSGITAGKDNVMTQTLDIAGQAGAGARFFDIRVAAASADPIGGEKAVELRSFHADSSLMKNETKTRRIQLPDSTPETRVTRTKLKAGAFGQSLRTMLEQADAFVTAPATSEEFLILKFDKCLNWSLIADTCVGMLGPKLYVNGGNLNTKTLADLAGKVVVLFSPEGKREIDVNPKRAHEGILPFKNLAKGDKKSKEGSAYDGSFEGLQYYGEFGATTWSRSDDSKIEANAQKQIKSMTKAKLMPPDVMRMMYWTSTGVFADIKSRDAKMWLPPNMVKFQEAWKAGMGSCVVDHSSHLGAPGMSPAAVASEIKKFMPNIIMMDFVDDAKCRLIFGLNSISGGELAVNKHFIKTLGWNDEIEKRA